METRMRIAQIAPVAERVPPKQYGGTERIVHELTEELVKRGHQVTLFASGDSITSAKLISPVKKNVRELKVVDVYGSNFYAMLNIGTAYAMQDEFDIIHDHNAHLSVATANLSRTPVVMTMHGPFTMHNRPLFEKLNNPHIVAISHAQTVPAPDLNYAGVVHHGLSMEHYPFSAKDDGYLLYVGRISEEKGVHYAVETAEYLDLPLIIAAKVDRVDMPYFKEKIEPKLNEKIRWIGEVGQKERNRLMAGALCFLHPVMWREPFGLTLIEAMACGTPVIAFRRGSIPEIVIDSKTGFVVEDLEEMIEAVRRVRTISREECRSHVLKNFNVEKMTDAYEQIYELVLRQHYTNEFLENGKRVVNALFGSKNSKNGTVVH